MAAALLAGLASVTAAGARYPGAPLLDTARPGEEKTVYAGAAACAAFDGRGYLGARGGFYAAEGLLLFGGVGHTEGLSHGLSIVSSDISATVAEAGVLWSLPLDLPVRLAARASGFKAFVPSQTYSVAVQNSATMRATLKMKASGAAVQLVGSREAMERLQLYGGLGLHFLLAEADLGYTVSPVYRDRAVQVEPGGKRYERGSQLDLGLAGGVAYQVAPNAVAMAELSYVKGGALAAGIRVDF